MAVHQQQETGWVGWLTFASVMMLILSAFHLIDGLVALFNDQYFAVQSSGLVVSVDYTAWGWVQLGLGVLIGAAALSLLSGHMYGRIIGIIIATISAVVNLAFLAAYPVWGVMMITMDVLVIYAIVVHGRELAR